MLERWTRAVLRFRLLVLVLWLGVLVVGAAASQGLPALLSNSFAVPGTESDRAAQLLESAFGERTDGTFTVVIRVARPFDETVQEEQQQRLEAAARSIPTSTVGELRPGAGVVYATVATRLDLTGAKGYADDLRRALAEPGAPPVLVTGPPAIQRDLDPVFASDLRRGELIAIPIALLVLIALFGVSVAVLVPFAFAACTITATLGAIWLIAHQFSMVAYVTNVVELIGLGLAVDYSLLIVNRFREELARGRTRDDAIVTTMQTAGRAVVASGMAVTIGLALLLFIPVPFVRSLGVGGALIPLASIAAALTLQPALLSLLGARGARGIPVRELLRGRLRPTLPHLPGSADVDHGFWARLARTIMRRPWPFLVSGTALLVAAAVPLVAITLTPGSISGIPPSLESARGLELLRDSVGPGAVTPTHVVIDTGEPGSTRTGPTRDAIDRLADRLFNEPEVAVVASGRKPPYVDDSGRFARVIVAGRHEYGDPVSQRFVRQLREELIPAARFPEGVTVQAGGAPPQGVDFLDRAYAVFPWLVAAVLALTFVVLMRTFRSLVLPLKAVLLNLLSVAAACGLLVLVAQWGVGADLVGLDQTGQIDGWIPILLFATLFGLSMDYEVFLVTRMRESWDHVPDNRRAVAHGLERTGRIVTAAAAIMVAAFLGFVLGGVAALQELGIGLILAIVIDATIVRMVLVPSLMAVVGRYNWWLPDRLARILRVAPSPLLWDGEVAVATAGAKEAGDGAGAPPPA